jgi:hypothetical protein
VAVLSGVVARKIRNPRQTKIEQAQDRKVAQADQSQRDLTRKRKAKFGKRRRGEKARRKGRTREQQTAAAHPFPPIEELELGEALGAAARGEDRVLLVQQEHLVPGAVPERRQDSNRRRNRKQVRCQSVPDA